MSNNNHTMNEDDVDDFLYGSDASEENYGMTSKPASKKNAEEDEEIYEQYNESLAKRASATSDTAKDENATEKEDNAMDEDQEDEEDSDDDLDIILEPEEDEHATDSQQLPSQKSQDELVKSSNPLVNIKLGQQGKESSSSNNTTATKSVSSGASGKNVSGGIDLDTVGEYNGQPITEVDVDQFEDKPWRKPGADITDYFNYGFNEITWRAYCSKQKTMREKKVSGKPDMDVPDFMSGMEVPDFMKMGMMMPMMDGGMPMGMPMGMMNPMMNMAPPQIGHAQTRGNPPVGTSSPSRSSGGGGRMNSSHGGSGGSSSSHSSSRGSRR